MTGDAVFEGDIGAVSGTFTGTLAARDGLIGGFVIENNRLYSNKLKRRIFKEEQKETQENHETNETYEQKEIEIEPELILNGTNGSIYANNIVLGTSATVEKYIKLGNAYLQNPDATNKFGERNVLYIETEVENSNKLLPVFALNDKGQMTLGNIFIDGATSQIQIGATENNIIIDGNKSELKGQKWFITPDTASFNDIVITKGIFKTGSIQCLGGAMLFKPAAKCKIGNMGGQRIHRNSIEFVEDESINTIEEINKKIGIIEGSWVLLTKFDDETSEPYQILREKENNNDYYYINSDDDLSIYDTIIYYCTSLTSQEGDSKTTLIDGLLIGVNSEDNRAGELVPRSISFTEMVFENGKPIPKKAPSMVIGDLSVLNYVYMGELDEFEVGASNNDYVYYDETQKKYIEESSETPLNGRKYFYKGYINDKGEIQKPDSLDVPYEGYGLYGNNVYLNGTLTTRVGNKNQKDKETYAGINTVDGFTANIFENFGLSDASKIIFWGGAEGRSEEKVKAAPFQVTEEGSLYASKGVFEGTLITKSTIQGSIIKAAKIYGSSMEELGGKISYKDAPLQIYNTSNGLGIQFRREEKDSNKVQRDSLTLSLTDDSFTYYDEEYYKTFDKEIDEEKTYYRQEGGKYFEIIYPNSADLSEYYEKPNTSTKFIKFQREQGLIPKVDAFLDTIEFKKATNNKIEIEDSSIIFIELGTIKTKKNNEEKINLTCSFSETLVQTDFRVNKNIIYGDEEKNMTYERIGEGNNFKGYDLYITSI